MNTVVRKYNSTAPRSRSDSKIAQHAAAKPIAGRQRTNLGRLAKPAASTTTSTGFMNSEG